MDFDGEISDLAERLGITLPTDGLAHNAVATPRAILSQGGSMEDERAGTARVSGKRGRPRLCDHPETDRTPRTLRLKNGKTYQTSYCRPCHAAKAKARSHKGDVPAVAVQLEQLGDNQTGGSET